MKWRVDTPWLDWLAGQRVWPVLLCCVQITMPLWGTEPCPTSQSDFFPKAIKHKRFTVCSCFHTGLHVVERNLKTTTKSHWAPGTHCQGCPTAVCLCKQCSPFPRTLSSQRRQWHPDSDLSAVRGSCSCQAWVHIRTKREFPKTWLMLSVMAHICNPSTWRGRGQR